MGGSASADTGSNLGVLKASVDLSLVGLTTSLSKFHDLPCVSKDSADHLQSLNTNAFQVSQTFAANYNNFMGAVTKPMAGSGRCDGGFHSVAVEMENRRMVAVNFAKSTYNLQMQNASSVDSEFNLPTIDIPDETLEQDCAHSGDKLYDSVASTSSLANSGFNSFRAGIDVVTAQFKAYAAQNSGLGNDCGSMPGDLGGMFAGPVAPIPTAPLPHGNSKPDDSTITGRTQDENLGNESGSGTQFGLSRRSGSGVQAVPGTNGSSITSSGKTEDPAGSFGSLSGQLQSLGESGAGRAPSSVVEKTPSGAVESMPSPVTEDKQTPMEGMISALYNSKGNAPSVPDDAEGNSTGGNIGASPEHSSGSSLLSPDTSLFDRIHNALRNRRI
jgi:hypothetical protein